MESGLSSVIKRNILISIPGNITTRIVKVDYYISSRQRKKGAREWYKKSAMTDILVITKILFN